MVEKSTVQIWKDEENEYQARVSFRGVSFSGKQLTYDLNRQARHEGSLVKLVEAILVAVICCAFKVDRAAILIRVVRGASEIEFVQLLIDLREIRLRAHHLALRRTGSCENG